MGRVASGALFGAIVRREIRDLFPRDRDAVLDAMKITLYENLKRSVVRYAQMERKQWVMFKEGADSASEMNLNLWGSLRWRRGDAASR